MGIDDRVGSIRSGMQADLLVVDGDPLDFTRYPANRRAVYRKGRPVRGALAS